jgi:uncharacterized protein with PQ loop repeat
MPHRSHKHVKKQSKEPIDYIIQFFVIATPLAEVPQALDIFTNHDASQVSLLTWGFFLFSSTAWLWYGIARKLQPLVVTSILYLVIEVAIVIGIVMYS